MEMELGVELELDKKMHVVVASLFTFTRRLFDRSTRLGPSINYANWALNVKRCLLGVEVSARAPVENINIQIHRCLTF